MKQYKLLAIAAAVALGTAPLSAQGKSGNAPKGGAPKTTSTAPTTHGNSGGAKNPNAGGPKASAPAATASGAGTDHGPEHHDRVGAQEQWQRAGRRQEGSPGAHDHDRVNDHGRHHHDHADHDDRNDYDDADAAADHAQPRLDQGVREPGAAREGDGDAAGRDDARTGQRRLPQPGSVRCGVERVEESRAGIRRPAEGDDGGRHEPGSGRQVRPDVAAGASSDTSSSSNDRHHDATDGHHDATDGHHDAGDGHHHPGAAGGHHHINHADHAAEVVARHR